MPQSAFGTSPFGRDGSNRVWQSLHPGIPFVYALLIGAWGGYLLYQATTIGGTDLAPTVNNMRWVTVLAFTGAFAAFMAGIRRDSIYFPPVLFLLLQEGMYAALAILWAWGGRSATPIPYPVLLYAVPGAFAAIFALALLVSAAVTVFTREWSLRQDFRTYETIPVEEERERRRIKTYFKPAPFWPWLIGTGGLVMALVAIFAPSEVLMQFNYPSWLYILNALFLLNLTRVISGRGRSLTAIDAPVFFILCYLSYRLVSLLGITFIYAKYGAQQWSAQWPSILNYYFMVLGIVVVAYCLAYRFYIYRVLRRANDYEMEEAGRAGTAPMLERGLARLGIDRHRMIAEPLMLRGVPDKDSVGQAFVGAFIGKDDVLRFTPQRCTVFAFTADQIHFFEATVDLTTGRVVYESVVEFFYQDVSNVARVNACQTIDSGKALPIKGALLSLFSPRTSLRRWRIRSLVVNDTVQFEGRDVFQINLESGRALITVLKDDAFFDIRKGRLVGILTSMAGVSRAPSITAPLYQTDLPSSDNERIMRNIRTMIREKKRTILGQRH